MEWLGSVSGQLERKVVKVPWWRWAAPLAAAAVAVAVFVLWLSRRPDERPGIGVAVLSRAVGVEWERGEEWRMKDAVLSPETMRLKAGAIEIEFYTGARVVVEAPAEFQIVSAKEAFLRSGKITAHVPPEARGFKVGSPNVSVVDYGTDFGFAVTRDLPPEVHVFDGLVKVVIPGAAPRILRRNRSCMVSIPANFSHAGLTPFNPHRGRSRGSLPARKNWNDYSRSIRLKRPNARRRWPTTRKFSLSTPMSCGWNAWHNSVKMPKPSTANSARRRGRLWLRSRISQMSAFPIELESTKRTNL